MRVKFITCSAGPLGVIFPGQVVEVSDKEAHMLIGGGYAVAVDEPAPPAPAEQQKEALQKKAATKKKKK